MNQTPSIFVSHSHTDDVWCRGFVDALQSFGYDVWYDAQSLRGGQQWRSEIERELAARDIFIVILTPAALTSQWVQKEIALADTERKLIVPIMHQNCTLQGFLKIIQVVNVVGKDYRAAASIVNVELKPPAPLQHQVSPMLQPPLINQTASISEPPAKYYPPPIVSPSSVAPVVRLSQVSTGNIIIAVAGALGILSFFLSWVSFNPNSAEAANYGSASFSGPDIVRLSHEFSITEQNEAVYYLLYVVPLVGLVLLGVGSAGLAGRMAKTRVPSRIAAIIGLADLAFFTFAKFNIRPDLESFFWFAGIGFWLAVIGLVGGLVGGFLAQG